ncbi:MAG TPA: VOC family protein [bacterium]|nr:VOC family protein [bacterium]
MPQLAHVALIVRSLDAPASLPVSALDLAPRERTALPGEGVTVSFITMGAACVELIQPVGPPGPLLRFLNARGEGIHHVALRVVDIEAAIARAAGAGIRVSGEAPRPGAHGARVAFLHPASLHGVLVELVEAAT